MCLLLSSTGYITNLPDVQVLDDSMCLLLHVGEVEAGKRKGFRGMRTSSKHVIITTSIHFRSNPNLSQIHLIYELYVQSSLLSCSDQLCGSCHNL